MNASDPAWVRVYQHEITRRQRILREKPKAYVKLFAGNPKKLNDTCETHVWVPATNLWIHDDAKNTRKGFVLDNVRRRGFSEAAIYRSGDYIVVPQMCWNCVDCREKLLPALSWSERQKTLADHIQAESKGKPRGRAGADAMLDDLDDLFGEV